jgi:hypothetical protein
VCREYLACTPTPANSPPTVGTRRIGDHVAINPFATWPGIAGPFHLEVRSMPEFHERNYQVTRITDPNNVLFATPFWTDAHSWIDDYCTKTGARGADFCVAHPINPIDLR